MAPANPDDTGDVESPFCRCNLHCQPFANEGRICWISGQEIPCGYFEAERAEQDARDQERASGEGMPGM